tara:strand:+ start:4671 stop:5492 length:822 start_codon:yes stop_codon:yes gene_type:complete
MIDHTDKVILPIGLEIDGVRYKEVVIDEMTGIDEENLTSRKIRNNGAKAISVLLRRCIQEIPGLLDRKKSPMDLIPERYVHDMYVADRDFLTLSIRALSDKSEFLSTLECPNCSHVEERMIDFNAMDVYEWDESEVELSIELPRGFLNPETNEYCNKVVWRFPKGKAQEGIASVPEGQMATYMIASGIKSVEGLRFIPSDEDVRRLGVRDRNAFAQMITDNAVGVDTKIEVCCESCGHEFNTEVNVMGFFNSGQGGSQKKKGGKTGRRKRKKA